jgi:hypothetical protein
LVFYSIESYSNMSEKHAALFQYKLRRLYLHPQRSAAQLFLQL